MDIVDTKNTKYVNEIVEIHMKTFTGFFLTFLGRGFLKTLYTGFMEHPQSGVILAVENNEVLGFCAYSEDLSGFYKYLIKTKLIQFGWYALGGFIRKPNTFFRLLRAFNSSEESKREEKYIQLASIGVSPFYKNKYVGSKMIDGLKKMYDSKYFKYISLDTDKDNNEATNHFYVKNGFVLDHSYTTPEGRNMNEYRFYLGE